MYYEQHLQFTKMLKNVDGILAKAAAYADHKKFDVNNFTHFRLAPDMFNLIRQVQITSDTAKFYAAQMTGKTAPVFEDHEKTWAELRSRVQNTVSFLETFKKEDFAKAQDAKVAPKWAGGKWMHSAEAYFQLTVPNFYFHVTVLYTMLRTNGVELGKSDYLGNLPFQG